MKQVSNRVTAILLTVLVSTVSSCALVVWIERVKASVCVGPGSQTAWLNLCAPAQGSTMWADDMNNNLRVLDAEFAPTSAAGGHQHTGSAGQGPQLLPTALQATNSPTNSQCLSYDGTSQKFQWGSCSTFSESNDHVWTGENKWVMNSTDTNNWGLNAETSGLKGGNYTANKLFDSSTSSGASTLTMLDLHDAGVWGGANVMLTMRPAHGGGEIPYFFSTVDPDTGNTWNLEAGAEGISTSRGGYFPDDSGRIMLDPSSSQTSTIADNGVGTPATATITPTKQLVEIKCQDADGCTVTLGETNVNNGRLVTIINASVAADPITIQDTHTVQNLSATWVGGQEDTLTLRYFTSIAGGEWVEIARSDN